MAENTTKNSSNGSNVSGTSSGQPPRVVIVGGGFGGLYAARTLHKAPLQVTVVDRTNHHVFQPLLYQVATAGLSSEQIAAPIRSVLRHQRNTEVLMAEVTGVDTEKRIVHTSEHELPYDYLILATGTRHSYFGHPEWEQFAPGLKSVADADAIRQKILTAFERAESTEDEAERTALLTFAIVGGGPTGTELAGQIAEIANNALASDFNHIDTHATQVLLLEAGPKILPSFDDKLSTQSADYLERMGVSVRTGAKVENVDADGVIVNGKRIRARTVIWAAGNAASPAARWTGVEMDRVGRAKILPDLTIPHHPEVFIIGDTAAFEQDGKPLPNVAQVAIQMGKYAAKSIMLHVKGKPALPPFRYFNKGDMATVGRRFAVYQLRELKTPSGKHLFGKIEFGGFFAWLMWLGVHIAFLVGFANRLIVLMQWGWAYLTFQRGARLIMPDNPTLPGPAPANSVSANGSNPAAPKSNAEGAVHAV